MGLGAFAAIGQTNIKRLLAYSAIGNIGYALIGLAAGSPEGARGVIIYMVIYVAMTLGAFACVLAMRRPRAAWWRTSTSWRAWPQTNLGMATVLAILMFSLAGIPPLAGFFAKFYVFVAAVKEGLWPLAVFGVLASVVGAYYYVRIVKIMFFDAPKEKLPRRSARRQRWSWGSPGLFVLLYVVWPAPLVDRAPMRRPELCFERHEPVGRPGRLHSAPRPFAASSSRKPAPPTPRRSSARWPASRARCGSWRGARRRAAGRSGRQWASEPGNLYASLLQTARLPASRSCTSSRCWPAWPWSRRSRAAPVRADRRPAPEVAQRRLDRRGQVCGHTAREPDAARRARRSWW